MNFTPIFEKELKTLIEDEFLLFQKLPNIPDYVADDIEEFRENHMEKVGLFSYEDYMHYRTKKWLMDIRNQLPFMQALSTGKYTVAKEKRFYLKDNRQLFNLENRDIVYSDLYLDDEGALITDKKYAKKFTQQEIDSMETGSYELIPVEEDV